jgi:hypothetical protein
MSYLKHAPLFLFSLTIGKVLFFQADWQSATAVVIAGILAGLYELKDRSKEIQDMKQNYDAEIKALKDQDEAIIKTVNAQAKAYDEVRTHVSGLSLAKTMKQGQPIQTPARF